MSYQLYVLRKKLSLKLDLSYSRSDFKALKNFAKKQVHPDARVSSYKKLKLNPEPFISKWADEFNEMMTVLESLEKLDESLKTLSPQDLEAFGTGFPWLKELEDKWLFKEDYQRDRRKLVMEILEDLSLKGGRKFIDSLETDGYLRFNLYLQTLSEVVNEDGSYLYGDREVADKILECYDLNNVNFVSSKDLFVRILIRYLNKGFKSLDLDDSKPDLEEMYQSSIKKWR